MRILWLSPLASPPANNSDRLWQNAFARELLRKGNDIFFIFFGLKITEESLRQMREFWPQFLYVPCSLSDELTLENHAKFSKALDILDLNSFDVIMTSCLFANHILKSVKSSAIKINIPHICATSHKCDFIIYKQKYLYDKLGIADKRKLFADVDIVVAHSAEEEKITREAYDKTLVSPRAIATDSGKQSPQNLFDRFWATLKRKRKRALILLDYPFWMVRYGGHAPGFLVMARYLRDLYSLDIFFHGNYDGWEAEQVEKLGLAANMRRAKDYESSQAIQLPSADDLLPAPLQPLFKEYHYRAFSRYLAEHDKYDVIIFFTIFNAYFAKAIPYDTLTILDTHDLWSIRNYIYDGKEPVLLTAAEEKLVYEKFSAMIFVEESEANFARKLAPAAISVYCPFSYAGAAIDFPENGIHFGFIAPAHILDPILWFIWQVWPAQRRADAKLHIFGTVCECLYQAPDNVVLHGIVESEEQIHSCCHVMLNPAFKGTGISTKTIMSLAYGRPVLATPVGARGVAASTSNGVYVARNRGEFIEGMLLLSHDAAALANYSKEALRFSREYLTVENAYAPLATLIENFQACA